MSVLQKVYILKAIMRASEYKHENFRALVPMVLRWSSFKKIFSLLWFNHV